MPHSRLSIESRRRRSPFPGHQPSLAQGHPTAAVVLLAAWLFVVGPVTAQQAPGIAPPAGAPLAAESAAPLAPPAQTPPAPVVPAATAPAAQVAVPLRRAHSHNDYEHDRPLQDALDHGFTSVEADIYLVDGQLLVAHDRADLQPERTLSALYLEPLRARAAQFQGQFWPATPGELILWIDIKSEAAATFARLQQELLPYADLIHRVEHGKTVPGPLLIVISGNRDMEAIAQAVPRLCTVDGRLPDLETSAYEPEVMRFVSDNWTSHFRWRGNGPMPAAERQKLRDLVQRAHGQQRRMRFWATPESEAVWEELLAAKVDLLNTDQLPRLQAFLQSHDR